MKWDAKQQIEFWQNGVGVMDGVIELEQAVVREPSGDGVDDFVAMMIETHPKVVSFLNKLAEVSIATLLYVTALAIVIAPGCILGYYISLINWVSVGEFLMFCFVSAVVGVIMVVMVFSLPLMFMGLLLAGVSGGGSDPLRSPGGVVKRVTGHTRGMRAISRATGIPVTRSGRQAKVGRMLGIK